MKDADVELRDLRDDWWYQHETGPDPDVAMAEAVGEMVMHVEFALAAREGLNRAEVDLMDGFDDAYERLLQIRNTLQRLLEDCVDAIDRPDRIVMEWPVAVAEHGPFTLNEAINIGAAQAAIDEAELEEGGGIVRVNPTYL